MKPILNRFAHLLPHVIAVFGILILPIQAQSETVNDTKIADTSTCEQTLVVGVAPTLHDASDPRFITASQQFARYFVVYHPLYSTTQIRAGAGSGDTDRRVTLFAGRLKPEYCAISERGKSLEGEVAFKRSLQALQDQVQKSTKPTLWHWHTLDLLTFVELASCARHALALEFSPGISESQVVRSGCTEGFTLGNASIKKGELGFLMLHPTVRQTEPELNDSEGPYWCNRIEDLQTRLDQIRSCPGIKKIRYELNPQLLQSVVEALNIR